MTRSAVSEIEDDSRNESPERLAADAAAYWAQSAARPWIRDLSHWRGQGRWADDRRWLAIGQRHREMVRRLLTLSGRTEPLRAILEWGPGGGANAVSFAADAPVYYGVDISTPNLEECGRQLAAIGYSGWRPVAVDAAEPEACLTAIDGPVDLAISTAVFQHFPGAEYGLRVMGLLGRILADSGVALIQIRYDDGSEAMRTKTGDYAAHAVTFTTWTIDNFWRIAADAGLTPLAVTLQPRDCYAFYWLRKG